jgi:curved DNA-binding protein CbpA
MNRENHYSILGLQVGASQDEIKEAYEQLSKELDPAENNNEDFFVEEYQRVLEAYTALTGIEPLSKSKPSLETALPNAPSGTGGIGEDDTLVAIMKKFRRGSESQKKDIIVQLTSWQSNNLRFADALQMILKKEGAQSSKDTTFQKVDKTKDSQKAAKLIPNKALASKTAPDSEDKPDSVKSFWNTNKWILLISASFMLIFLVPYIIFNYQLKKFKEGVLVWQDQEAQENQKRKEFWGSKWSFEEAEKGIYYGEDSTLFFGKIDYADDEIMLDTTFEYFIYAETIIYKGFKENYFECLHNNYINRVESKANLDQKEIWMRSMIKKYNISKETLNYLLELIDEGKLYISDDLFPVKVSPNDMDKKCMECIPNYTSTNILNAVALEEASLLVKDYVTKRWELDKTHRSSKNKYQREYNEATKSLEASLRKKLDNRLKSNATLSGSSMAYTFSGSEEGIGNVNYSLITPPTIDARAIKNIVNELYADYYQTNTLRTGSTPYSYCFGSKNSCNGNNCSKIKVISSTSSDVIVVIKKGDRVYRHAYIKASGTYEFNFEDGFYGVYFYYGNGWNPKKFMKNTSCGKLMGGFVSNESVNKDLLQDLNNDILTYTLRTTSNGNFKPFSSSINDAF